MRGGERTTSKRVRVVFGGLGALLVALMVANLCMGSLSVSLHELVDALSASHDGDTVAQVIWSIRLPRLVAAGLLGGALALSGVLLQIFFNNPLAGPFVLGISSGAKLAVALVMVVIVGATGVMTSWMSVMAAFCGSLAIMLVVIVVSRRVRSSSTLVVAGIMLGYVCSALTDFLVTFASDASIVSLRNWSMGSFSGTNWDDVRVISVVVAASCACACALIKSLGAYLMGEDYARSVGVNVRAFRLAVIGLSSLLAASVVAFAGPISFVGIAVPHLTKRLLHTSKPLLVVPGAFLGGACFCLFCDLVARTLFAPTEMSVSTVTAVLGAPVVIWVLLERKRRAPHDDVSLDDTPRMGADESTAWTCKNDSHGSAESAPRVRGVCLQTEGLTVGYGVRPVVGDVDVEVAEGQLVTLIGPNGVGKSTVLRTVAGLQEELDGRVRLAGKDAHELTVHERSLLCAVLLTERPSTEFLTCSDVVESGRYPHTGRMGILSKEDLAHVRESMQLMQVWDLRGRDFMQISDGQRQRVMIARALCQQPRLLVLDEPTSFLDIRYQIELFSMLRDLARIRQVGVLMSLHDVVLARQVSDWIVCVKDGSVQCQGTPDEVFVSEVINSLYDLREGTYDPLTGAVKLEKLGKEGD